MIDIDVGGGTMGLVPALPEEPERDGLEVAFEEDDVPEAFSLLGSE